MLLLQNIQKNKNEVIDCLGYLFSQKYTRFSPIHTPSKFNEKTFAFAKKIYKRGEIKKNSQQRLDEIQISNDFFIPKIHLCNENDFTVYLKNLNQKSICMIVDKFFLISDKGSRIFFLEANEKNKNLDTVFQILEWISNLNSDCPINHIVAMGGGMTLDVSGFVASLLQTNLSFIPTTLLGAIDATLGGKTGVNFEPYGKNQVGSFYFCHEIILASHLFDTLPHTQIISGLCETLKHAWISGKFIENEKIFYDIFYSKIKISNKFILDNLETKLKVVAKDPFEHSGLRSLLNFGHTIGHAIEILSLKSDTPIQHGIAVAHGMSFVLNHFYELNTPPLLKFRAFLKEILKIYPFDFKKYSTTEWEKVLVQDKKNSEKGTLSLSLPDYGILNSQSFENFCTMSVPMNKILKGIQIHE